MINKPIRSDDPNALEQLNQKLQRAQELQETMKTANAHFRKNHTMQGFRNLTDEQAAKLDAQLKDESALHHEPYPTWVLQNNNQEIYRLQNRIKQIEAEQNREAVEYDTEHLGFVVEENQELCRLQISFPGKPKEKVREELKSCGFHWSPKNDCWQRLLNNSARYSVQSFIRSQEQAQKKEMEVE